MTEEFNKHNVTAGNYLYTRPGWCKFDKCIVIESEGKLFARMIKGYRPLRITNFPEDGIFIKDEETND